MQGPSLLTSTGEHRSSPILFQLPGLRSLPFWTSNNSDSGLKVVCNEPILTSIVSYLESNVEIIKSECIDAMQSQNTPSDYDVKDEHMEGSLHTGKWNWHVDLAERHMTHDMFRYAKEQVWISNNNDAGK